MWGWIEIKTYRQIDDRKIDRERERKIEREMQYNLTSFVLMNT